jgi:hypothetical protein
VAVAWGEVGCLPEGQCLLSRLAQCCPWTLFDLVQAQHTEGLQKTSVTLTGWLSTAFPHIQGTAWVVSLHLQPSTSNPLNALVQMHYLVCPSFFLHVNSAETPGPAVFQMPPHLGPQRLSY